MNRILADLQHATNLTIPTERLFLRLLPADLCERGEFDSVIPPRIRCVQDSNFGPAVMKMRLRRYLLLATLLGAVGCVGLQDAKYCYTNKFRAECAWLHAPAAVRCGWYGSDYAKGWRKGYFDVAMGGNGLRPAVPPKCYWHPSYQCEAGMAKVESWFQGYESGAAMAQSDGRDGWNKIPTSGTSAWIQPGELTDSHGQGVLIESTPAGVPASADGVTPPPVPPTFAEPERVPVPKRDGIRRPEPEPSPEPSPEPALLPGEPEEAADTDAATDPGTPETN